jgi:outer membrane receptor protein involved in Fe transport
VQNDRLVGLSIGNPDQVKFPLRTTVSAAVMCALLAVPDGARAQQAQKDASDAMSEVLVTAEKRVENLQEVPVPVTVVNTDALAEESKVLIKDYFSSIPGLSMSPSILGNSNLAIRGITTSGFTNPTVAVLVDDTPFTASTNNFNAGEVPDIDPGDLSRIEVLRGPQGTLYGANAMGGIIKYVTKDPSTDALSGRVEAGTNQVYNGTQLGFSIRGSVNIPLTDTLAIRMSAFTRQDPGYIDDPVAGTQGVNETKNYGTRIAALWHPSEDFSIKLSALYQRSKAMGNSEVDIAPGLSDLQQNYLRGSGGYDRTIQAYAATLNYKLHDIQLTSVTGYNITRTLNSLDYTSALGDCCTQPAFGVSGTQYVNQFNLNKLTQELRATVPIGPVELLFGGFYTHESLPGTATTVYAQDVATAQVVGVALRSYYDGPAGYFDEYAGFATLTYHFTDQFDLQVGGRESWDKEVDTPQVSAGPFVPSFFGVDTLTYTSPQLEAKGSTFTYLVTPRYRISSNLMVYARAASGYRPGGPNSPDRVATGAPPSFSPDKTQSYEIGVKTDLLDHTLSLDASLYYIKWKDIQLQLLDPYGNSYGANGGAAKSQGVEFSATARPAQGLSISAWINYIDAVLTEDMPPNSSVVGQAGDRLPLTSRYSGNLAAEQSLQIKDDLQAFVGGEISYVGDRLGQFQGTNTRQEFPSYTKVDMQLGIKNSSWKTSLYVNNVADKRGVLTGGAADLYNPEAFIYIQPRTIGVTLVRTF